MKRPALRTTALISVAALTALGGCRSPEQKQADRIRHDLTPELELVALTGEETDNQSWANINRGFRDMREEWLRAWHADTPSRLSPYPTSR